MLEHKKVPHHCIANQVIDMLASVEDQDVKDDFRLDLDASFQILLP